MVRCSPALTMGTDNGAAKTPADPPPVGRRMTKAGYRQAAKAQRWR